MNVFSDAKSLNRKHKEEKSMTNQSIKQSNMSKYVNPHSHHFPRTGWVSPTVWCWWPRSEDGVVKGCAPPAWEGMETLPVGELKIFQLTWADLGWFELIWAHLRWFELVWADLSWFELIWADLSWFELIWADLRWFELIWADLSCFELIWQIGTNRNRLHPRQIVTDFTRDKSWQTSTGTNRNRLHPGQTLQTSPGTSHRLHQSLSSPRQHRRFCEAHQ